MYQTNIHQIIKNNYKMVYWIPRVLSIVLIALLTVLAFDVFSMDLLWYETIFALFIHLVPSFIVAILLFISWHNELIGAIIYTLLAILMLFAFNVQEDITVIVIPLIILSISALFYYNWIILQKIEKDQNVTSE